MKITNKYNLSRSRVNLAHSQLQRPRPDTLRVTQLIDSPRIRQLQLGYWEDIEIDASDVDSSSIYGTAKHYMLAQATDDDYESAVPLLWHTNEPMIKWVKGELDHYDTLTATIEDDKWGKSWNYVFSLKDYGQEWKPEWENQLNMYAFLLKMCLAKNTEHVVINAYYLDWLKRKANEPTYPSAKELRLELPLWSKEKQKSYYLDRVDKHVSAQARFNQGHQPPLCTSEERWNKPVQWAVMKKGQKKAVKLFYDKEEAEKWLVDNPDCTNIEFREDNQDRRCKEYCKMVCRFCDYWRENYGD